MTRSEFAYAVRADEKWVENASLLLGRRFAYTLEEAVWLGLVRELISELGLTLAKAVKVADEALGRHEPDKSSFVSVTIDLPRYHSTHAISVSAAQKFAGPKRRGRARPKAKSRKAALENASRYGVDVDLLRAGLEMSRAERLEALDRNAAFLTELRHSATKGGKR